MRIVALEEHVSVPSLTAQIPREAVAARGLLPFEQSPVRKQLEDAGDARLADMDDAGVTLEVLSVAGPGADLLDPAHGPAFARAYNDHLQQLVAPHPDRFAAFAHLPLSAPEAAADELSRAVEDLGFCGALINGTTTGLFLDDPRFEPLLARAEALNRPLYLHPSIPPQAIREAYYGRLPELAGFMLSGPGFGWHAETAIHVLRLVLAGALDRHPRLQLIVGHMGETLPMWLDRFNHVFSSFASGNLTRPVGQAILDQVFITTSGFFSAAPFAAAMASFGPERILFSIDYPYSRNAVGTAFLRNLPVSEEDRERIAHGNADRLLGLTQPPKLTQ